MVQEKKKRSDLAVPKFVAEEWAKGTAAREQMADVLQNANWDKDSVFWKRKTHLRWIEMILISVGVFKSQ